jgi:transaldolase
VNRLSRLRDYGQSAWLDDLRRDWLFDGTIERFIEVDGIRGLTTNPAILEHALRAGGAYQAAIRELVDRGVGARAAFQLLTIEDVRRAADLLAGVFESSAADDGFVSIEVDPSLVDDAEATVAEASDLWQRLDRPNVMIKVPATAAGISAASRLLEHGIPVNLTLIFGRARLAAVQASYLEALERRLSSGRSIKQVRSVASVFVSRLDSWVDGELDRLQPDRRADLGGRAAVAFGILAYDDWCRRQDDPRWRRLAALGARPQNLLWASTSTKNPSYSPTLYVDSLIGAQTINTMPPQTLAAFLETGTPSRTLPGDTAAATALLDELAALGIDLDGAAAELEGQGIEKFAFAYERALALLAARLESTGSRRS